MKIAGFFFLAIFLVVSCTTKQEGFDVEKTITSADVIRNTYKDTGSVSLYQGNGLFGCSYGPLGLHDKPGKKGVYDKTQYMHMDHRGRGKFGADYLLPLSKIYWEKDFTGVSAYRQRQSFFDGIITTSFQADEGKVKVNTWFDPVEKNLACISIVTDRDLSNAVVFEPLTALKVHYSQQVTQSVQVKNEYSVWKIDLNAMGTTTTMYVETNANVEFSDSKLFIHLKEGVNDIRIAVHTAPQAGVAKSLEQTENWWHTKWKQSGLLKFPDQHAQEMWVRSMAQFFFSYTEEMKGLPPPEGFSGNGWPFDFSQDVSYVHPVLLATGNKNIAKAWIEYFYEGLPGMREYTKRLFHTDGILSPWVYPYGDFKGYHDPFPPNKFYYEIHNSGYLARMTAETADFVDDSAWTKKFALPLLQATAEFYKNICRKEADGFWHLFVKPSMGQDEYGGEDQEDYLCVLYSTQYCFEQAVRFELDTDKSYSTILQDGLAFTSLKSGRGFYFTSGGSGEKDFGNQKHPVQLNELTFLPVNKQPSEAAAIAHRLRYTLLVDSKIPIFHGWSLGAFLLADTRMGNAKEWERDWNNLTTAENIDPEWIQVYESSGKRTAPYYNTTNGLITQSLLGNVICDWYGKLEIAKCYPWEEATMLKDIYSSLGVKINGNVNKNSCALVLTAWKDCEFDCMGNKVIMKKGDAKNMNLKW